MRSAAGRLLFLLLLLSGGYSAFAQDPEFTQFYANPLYLNPAFAGSGRCPRFVMDYRNQWPVLTGTFVTSYASYDQHFDALQGGLGLSVYSDKAGEATITTTNVSGMYAYSVNLNRRFSFKFGIQGSYIQKGVDWAKMVFGDMIDKRYGTIFQTSEVPTPSRSYPDFSAGVLAYSTSYYGGIAVHHLTEPQEGFSSLPKSYLPRKYTVHGGALIPIEKGGSRKATAYISPNILYQQQLKFQQFNGGLYVIRDPLVGGIWYRYAFSNSDAVIVLAGLQHGIFKFGYSYDITVSKLAAASGGSHEFSFSTQFQCKPKRKKFRTIHCPSF